MKALYSTTRRRKAAVLISAVVLTALAGCGRDPGVVMRGDRFDPVRRLIARTMRKYDAASLSIAAAKDGRVVWEESFGLADLESWTPADTNSIYALASISKSFTATAVMVLVEKGLVDLDRPVNGYLGPAKLASLGGDAELATVRRVLQFEAGLPVHHNLFPEGGPGPPRMDESIRRYGIVVEQPGTGPVYSNFGYGVLGRMIEVLTGLPYRRFMKDEVFIPLGLTCTAAGPDSTLEGDLVTCYDASGRAVPWLDSDHRGASAVRSSVHDLIRYGMFHLGDGLRGQEDILGPGSLSAMKEPSPMPFPGSDIGKVSAGMGWAVVDLEGFRFVLSTGGMPGTVARLALVPGEDAAVAILMNNGLSEVYSPWEIEWETFRALIEGFPPKPRAGARKRDSRTMPEGFAGEWTGSIRTCEGGLGARLILRDAWNPVLEIDGRRARTIRVRNPLGRARFDGDIFEAPFDGTLQTSDCARSPHVLYARLRLDGDRLTGVVSAVARDRSFWLPHWIELTRDQGEADGE